MPQGGYRGAEELGTGKLSGDKATKRKPLKVDATMYRPSKGGFTGFDGDKSLYSVGGSAGDAWGLSKAQNDELNASAARSEKMARDVAAAAAIGGNVGTRANRLVNAGPATTPVGPLQGEASAARDRLRMQIATEQQKLLADRRAGKIARGDGTDTESLSNIAALRREMAGYDSAARPSQRPNTPEQNMMASRDAANQAAKIMQGDLAAMEQKVYTMPPGPMRDAEVEKLRAFKDKTNQQFIKGNVLRPDDTGPPVPGSSSTDYADAMATAEGQTASQMEAAGRDYDRRQNVLGFTKELTAKRMADEQRARDVKDATFSAGMAGIRRPEDEFRMKQDAMAAEIANIQAKTGVSKAEAEKMAADTAVSRDKISSDNPERRLAGLQGDVLVSEMNRRNNVANGTARPQTPEEIATKREQTAYALESAGADEAPFMQASTQLQGAIGGPMGDSIVTDGPGALKASNVMLSTAQALRDAAQTQAGAEAAKVKARQLLAGMGVPASGQYTAGRSLASSMAGGIAGITAEAAAIPFGGLLTGGAPFRAAQAPFELDTNNKRQAAQNLNTTIALLKQIAGQ